MESEIRLLAGYGAEKIAEKFFLGLEGLFFSFLFDVDVLV